MASEYTNGGKIVAWVASLCLCETAQRGCKHDLNSVNSFVKPGGVTSLFGKVLLVGRYGHG